MLVLLGVGSALVRHYFNLRNMHQQRGWVLPVAALFLVALIWMTRPISPASIHTTQGGDARFWQVRQVIDHHCTSCHSANPTDPVFTIAPMGLTLDTPEEIQAAAPAILDRAVRTQTMPLGNASEMSEEDRGLLGRWIESGARIE